MHVEERTHGCGVVPLDHLQPFLQEDERLVRFAREPVVQLGAAVLVVALLFQLLANVLKRRASEHGAVSALALLYPKDGEQALGQLANGHS